MNHINKQRFLAELSKLLGFMSTADRQSVIEKYGAMFDSCENEATLISELGSPTKLAISLAREYVPSPADESSTFPSDKELPSESITPAAPEIPEICDESAPVPEAAQAAEPLTPMQEPAAETGEEPASDSTEEAPAGEAIVEGAADADDSGPVFAGSSAVPAEMFDIISRSVSEASGEAPGAPAQEEGPAQESVFFEENVEETPPDDEAAIPAAKPARRAKPVALVFYILLSIVIGLPIAVALICLGVPFIAAGAGVVVGAVYGVISLLPLLNMFSDILLSLGVTLVASAAGLVIAWFGLWVCLELGHLWIGRVVFRLGSRLCFKKEDAE